ncbi:MAG TPA: YHS domain-containing protein [Ignavibacteria bacterium]|nr:YHS domain-containing protein [Ignavibacteria bacterium]
MKTKLFLASLFIALFALTVSNTYSQDKECCKDKSSSHCGDMKSGSKMKSDNGKCCDKHGNAGGDSTVSTGMTCPVSGEAIGEGQGVKFSYYGKDYTFCCDGCVAKFKKEPMNYIKEEMTCPVMGEKIESKDVFVMHEGTKYYLCCKSCVKKFESDPDKYKNGPKN